MNYYIANKSVLVPIYDDPNDAVAMMLTIPVSHRCAAMRLLTM
ncbi:hypothetical protein [Chitinophaga defluvii]|uniref:Uncharacterized protein n=1 Tax=Chitinophaga defluvii TaxID=3163343 RepID=A0ABV2T392_9BACT